MKIDFSLIQYFIDNGWTFHSFKGENLMTNEDMDHIDCSYKEALALQMKYELEELGGLNKNLESIIKDQNLSRYLRNRQH